MAEATVAAEPLRAKTIYSNGYRTWLLALLLVTYTLNFVDRTIVAVLAQPIKLALHLSDTQLGLLGGLAFAAFYTGVGIPMARLAERMSRVVIMAVSVALWSAMTAAGGLAQTYLQLALARMGVGIGEAGFLPTSHSLISDHFPPSKRASALAVFSLAIPLGSLIGAVSGGWIAQHLNWRIAFFTVGAPGLIVSLLVLSTLKEPPRGNLDAADSSGPPPSTLAVLRRLASKPGVIWAVVGASCASIGGYGVGNFLGPYLNREFGMGYAQAGLIGGLIVGAPTCIGTLFGGLISDLIGKWDKRGYAWVPASGLLIATPVFVYALMRPTWVEFFTVMLIGAIGQQLYLGPTFGVVNNSMEPRMRATAIAFMSVCLNLFGLGFGPTLTGLLSDKFGGALSGSAGADVLSLCHESAKAACNISATGLQYAMIVMTGFYALGGLAFLMASRTLRRDLAS